MGQVPSVGRVVHYVSYGTPGGEYASECRAAIITEVPGPRAVTSTEEDQLVGLAVLNPSGMFFNEAHQDEDQHTGGTWHWPERVEA